MSRREVFLTYKRKRQPNSDLYLKNGLPDTPSGCLKSDAIAPLPEEEEKYENHSCKDEKKDFEDNTEEANSLKGSRSLLSDGEPRSSHKRLCSCIPSGCGSDCKCTQKFSLSPLTGLNTLREQDLVTPSTSGEGRCNLQYSDISDLQKPSLEEADRLNNVSQSISVNAVRKSKSVSTLITFQRRAKREKDAGRADAKCQTKVEDVACLSDINIACLVTPHGSEESVPESCFMDLSADFKHPEVNPYPRTTVYL